MRWPQPELSHFVVLKKSLKLSSKWLAKKAVWIWVVNYFRVALQKQGENTQIIHLFIGFSMIFTHPFWGPTPIFGNTHLGNPYEERDHHQP